MCLLSLHNRATLGPPSRNFCLTDMSAYFFTAVGSVGRKDTATHTAQKMTIISRIDCIERAKEFLFVLYRWKWYVLWTISLFVFGKFWLVYFILSAAVAIFVVGLREEDDALGTLSAYSIFNPRMQSLPGTFRASQIEQSLRSGSIAAVGGGAASGGGNAPVGETRPRQRLPRRAPASNSRLGVSNTHRDENEERQQQTRSQRRRQGRHKEFRSTNRTETSTSKSNRADFLSVDYDDI